MKKFIVILALCFLPSAAFAQAYAMIISQRNANDNGIVSRLVLSPVNTHGFFYHEPLTRIPRWGKFGPNCYIALDILNCKGTDVAGISDATAFGKSWLTLSDVGAAQQLLDIPSDTAELTNGAGFITSAPVTSVNGYTGEVELSSADVGAASATHTHDSSSITTGTFSAFRIPELGIEKITNLQSELDSRLQVGAPVARTFALETAYRCINVTRPCTLTVTLQATSTDTEDNEGVVTTGSTSGVATGSGADIATFKNNVSVVGSVTQSNTYTVMLPIGHYVALRQTVGTDLQILSAVEQPL